MLEISPLRRDNWDAVRAIYAEGIATGNATFETHTPEWETWDGRHLDACRLIATLDGEITGWAALSPVSERCVYGGVAEVSVYVAADRQRRGVGSALLCRLIADSEKYGLWTLQAGIFPENAGSIAMHRKAGFREVGRRERIGKMRGVWRDVVLLERRSSSVGKD